MKNAINYFYNLYPDKIYKEKNHYYFYLDDIKLCIYKFERNIIEINELVRVSNELYKNKILVSTFISTKNGDFSFLYEEENYILLKINNYENDIIDLYDISNFNNILMTKNKDTLNNIDWFISWQNTVDLIEETIKDFNNEYPLLQESINYYIGLAENAIMYIKNAVIDVREIKYVISHRRINSKINIEEFYNPINFIFDYEIRDLSQYIQSSFFNNNFDMDEFEKYINYKNFNRTMILLFFGRLLYPSYYFDLFQMIINEEINEKVLKYYNDKTKEYEDFLIDIYNLLNSKYSLPSIEWLNQN